ncbi:xanthine dehydrogenase accessory protein XdhC [Silvimonas iriomotensis]|uniref:Xanthine dehydrogenase accessory protein XdhC n=1 Tax=Silvimonas iriomotensis TaxID=449662 RepID=A0ABQ2PFA8_9NEIS|nr:xanthine dehydrogenase accessory protein XdhC [Silvimonas iriomotensis]GGP24077.1 xanthine dehydrogenase accessory protein XdhC [Silvimonas iriomotensis]
MSHWMQQLARRLAQGDDQVLVTVARAEGSTPRDAGTVMLVGPADTHDTIGGGHLEWEAITMARVLLAGGPQQALLRFSLGARLGQCCGGVVWLALERISATEASAWQQRALALREGAVVTRQLRSTGQGSDWHNVPATDHSATTTLEGDLKAWSLTQTWLPHPFTVMLFGAGHVGAALVHVLAPLGIRLQWIDERETLFGDMAIWPDNVQCIATDTPQADIAAAAPGTCFLLMTHNHALDFELCQAIFKRDDFDYFGMIGSHSKRVTFEHRLRDRGVPVARFKEMICPIGVPGITTKEPAAIAIAVAAQLLQVRERRRVLGRRLAHTSNDHTLADPPPNQSSERV